MPKISVIVPVYNTEKYLHRCIDSILAQTFTDFELLLIDDGSKDNSGAICDEYAAKDQRVRVFHKKNGGVSSARNLGLDNAQGEWITFVDSDDWVKKEYIELFINNADDLVYQSFLSIFNGQTEVWDTSIRTLDVNECLTRLYEKKVLGYCWGKLYTLQKIKKYNVRFDENIRFREDELFVLKYLSHTSHITCINKKKYIYNRPNWEKYDGYDDVYTRLELFKVCKDVFPFSDKIIEKYLLDVVGYIISQYQLHDYKTLRTIQKETRRDIFRLNKLSFPTKALWYISPLITHIYFLAKSKLKY